MTAPLPELREADAPPEIVAIYAALRQASAVPLVNLIYRHLATLPGVLPWVWQAIRPPLEDGRLAGARERLVAALPVPEAVPLPRKAASAAGLAPGDLAAVAALVETYNRGNLTNLLLLTALRRALEDAPAVSALSPPPVLPRPAMLPAPPPLPRLADLPPRLRAAVLGLAARHGESGVVPSLYLHLAHWPDLPAALPDWLDAALLPASLSAGRDAVVVLATAEADGLRPGLGMEGEVPGGHRAKVLAAMDRFTLRVIPEMIPVGLALRRVLAAFA